MLPPVFARLKTSSALTALVASRIYRHGSAPQDSALSPYITWTALPTPENTLSETPGIDRVTLQIDCWSDNDTQVETVATLVRDTIEPVAHMTGVIIDSREPDTKLYRISLQFDWWLSRPGP